MVRYDLFYFIVFFGGFGNDDRTSASISLSIANAEPLYASPDSTRCDKPCSSIAKVKRWNTLSQLSGMLVQLLETSTRLTARVAAKADTTCVYDCVRNDKMMRDESCRTEGERKRVRAERRAK
jgi:hypothetical protein